MMHADAHRSWSVRPLAETDLEAYLDIYLNSYPAYKDLDRACRDHYREKHRRELREDTQTKTVGLFEGANLIATMKLILFSMNFFGQMQPACGLMALEVHPLHKKKGAALFMVRCFEDYARENGALLTLLLPFRIDFYRRMGYGFAGKIYEYHLPTAALPEPRNGGKVRRGNSRPAGGYPGAPGGLLRPGGPAPGLCRIPLSERQRNQLHPKLPKRGGAGV